MPRKNRLICSIFFAPICRVVYALLPGLVWGARRDFIQNTAFFSPFIRKSTGMPPIFLHFPLRYAILSCELNRKTAGAFCRYGGGKGKREAGANPARSRHCDKGARVRVLCTSHWSFALRRRRRAAIFQPGNLPAVGTGAKAPDHEELVVPKKL